MIRKALMAACALGALAMAGTADAAKHNGKRHAAKEQAEPVFDLVIHGGTIYDGAGGAPYVGDVAIKGDRIVYVGKGPAPGLSFNTIDAKGKAVSPGFVNMLSWATESLMIDGRGQSDLRQGVTLEVFGEGESMGPLTPTMKSLGEKRQGDFKYPITWTSLDQYLTMLQHKGVSMNVASFVGAATVRENELGERDIQPTPAQMTRMRGLVKKAMEDGALGVGASLIYAPANYARTPELSAMASESAKCGGVYIAHMRSEGDRLLEAVDETLRIGRESGGPVRIYHMKAAGKPNWAKEDTFIDRIEKARASGQRVSANMYTYTAGATGLDAAMPPWVQDGGLEAWIERMKDPKVRTKLLAEMRDPNPKYENLYLRAGPEGTLLLGFKNDKLKPLTGRTLASVAEERHESPEDAAIDLVIEDGSRVGVAYFLMSEDNVKRQLTLPWVSFGSDADAEEPTGVFLKSQPHPRSYGNFARVLGHYVRDEKVLTLPDAIRRLSALPSQELALKDRGMLKKGYFADVVVFDPTTIADHATYPKPQQFATGVEDVLVNGKLALKDGEPTGAATGRVVRGRAWKGWKGGGCKASAKMWRWYQ
jgi:N-acyl-D-amino-acid deacylase